MKLGIVGLPNVGKSTLFNSLTKAGAESANYPFCTIDPNVGVVTVPDERLKLLGDFYHSKKVTPAVIEFVDIAGLVKGASKGEGLGNQFLANIREVDAIVHVVRCFEDSNVIHVDGSIDPIRIYVKKVQLLVVENKSLLCLRHSQLQWRFTLQDSRCLRCSRYRRSICIRIIRSKYTVHQSHILTGKDGSFGVLPNK